MFKTKNFNERFIILGDLNETIKKDISRKYDQNK